MRSQVVGAPCADIKTQSLRSLELQKIRKADQLDRSWQVQGLQPSNKLFDNISRNDLLRRKRVGEIFAEGCLNSVADYEAAYLVYQHGNTPDHFFQAFLWSKKAVSLGDLKAKGEVAMAIDRYLVSLGHKQLFGTQAFQSHPGDCWCIHAIEESFPKVLRDEYRGGENAAYTGLQYLKILNSSKSCPTAYCPSKLKASPTGIVPGFW